MAGMKESWCWLRLRNSDNDVTEQRVIRWWRKLAKLNWRSIANWYIMVARVSRRLSRGNKNGSSDAQCCAHSTRRLRHDE